MKKLLAIIPLLAILAGCLGADPGFQYPKGTVFCRTKYDCHRHQYCGFITSNTYAVCRDKTN